MSTSLKQGAIIQGEKNAYVIDKTLGQGSFGITYLAQFKTRLSGAMGSGYVTAQVCIKEFFMKDFNTRDEKTGSLNDTSGVTIVERYRRAFMREAKNLARMHHPGIVNVFEVIEANNTVYIVMEYIDGGSLDDYIRSKGHLSEEEAVRCIRPICEALDDMHRQRMLHLDMKPKNVMRDKEGHLYLIDFGLSKQYDANGEPESSTSIGLGTQGYAPLEQAEQNDDEHNFRATIDVYALGATLYKMLTGQTPPKATEVSSSVLDGEDLIQQNLTQIGVSMGLAQTVSKAMWPSSKKRVQSVAELLSRLTPAKPMSEETVIKAEEEQKRQAEQERLRKEAEAKAAKERAEAEARAKAEQERKAREEAERKAKAEAARKAREEAARKKREAPSASPSSEPASEPVVVVNDDESTILNPQKEEPITIRPINANGHDYVDLGLKDEKGRTIYWATCNVGASKPEDYGLYFAWGETKGYISNTNDGRKFYWEHYKWCKQSRFLWFKRQQYTITKYCVISELGTVDNKKILDLEDDAAHVNWGGDWRMPTYVELDQLKTKCQWTWDSTKKGYKIKGPNGNSIFLPAAGYRDDASLSYAGSCGNYWSSSLGTSNSFYACCLYFNSGYVDWYNGRRYYGRTVRAVCVPSK